jgi:hypothetical protein
MEEIIPSLRNMLKEAIKVEIHEKDLEIHMLVKTHKKLGENFADPNEVKIMLHMFGGLQQEFPLEVKIDNEEQKIILIFDSLENLAVVQKALETMWDKSVELLEQLTSGDFGVIRDIGDIDE